MKIKKNQSGMTLVEVVIALGVFSFTFLGVTMCLSAALKLNNRNMLRDRELNTQQKVIEEHKVDGVALLSTAQGGLGLDGNSIVFGSSAIPLEDAQLANGFGTLGGVTLYHAVKTAAQGNTYNFEIKGLTSTPLGNSALEPASPANGIYRLHVVNNCDKNVDVEIHINSGEIFEGSRSSGYVNSSSIYARTLPASTAGGVVAGFMPSELLIGYATTPGATPSDITITCYVDGGSSFTKTVSSAMLSGGAAHLEINSSGGAGSFGAGEDI